MNTKRISLRGLFIRELIRGLVSIIKVNGFLLIGKSFLNRIKFIKVPQGYKNKEFMIMM